MASPPAMKGLYSPWNRLSSAVPPSPSTTLLSLSHRAPVTDLSAVTTTLFDTGSMDQDGPGMVASFFSVVRAPSSWARVWVTILALAPLASTAFAAVLSSTFTTRLLALAS